MGIVLVIMMVVLMENRRLWYWMYVAERLLYLSAISVL